MGALGVVVGDEFGEEQAQVRLVERDHVIEALVPEGAHHPLGDRVRPRRAPVS